MNGLQSRHYLSLRNEDMRKLCFTKINYGQCWQAWCNFPNELLDETGWDDGDVGDDGALVDWCSPRKRTRPSWFAPFCCTQDGPLRPPGQEYMQLPYHLVIYLVGFGHHSLGYSLWPCPSCLVHRKPNLII